MKILVSVKRVEDPGIKIRLKADGSGIDNGQMKYVINPFDEIAVEEALRARDAYTGEVIVVTVGPQDAQQQLRAALAMGADRGVHVTTDALCDPYRVALALQHVVKEENPDLIIMGKQAIDDDMGQVGPQLAELLGWAQATFLSKVDSLDSPSEKAKKTAIQRDGDSLQVIREIDGGIERLAVRLPAVLTTELRLNVARYASLPGIVQAKKKPVREITLDSMNLPVTQPVVQIVHLATPPSRKAGVRVTDVQELVNKLRNEAKVL